MYYEIARARRSMQAAANAHILLASIRPGDRVTINIRGQLHSGKAVMPAQYGGWVLNMGGPHGRPGIADENNIVSVKRTRRRHGG